MYWPEKHGLAGSAHPGLPRAARSWREASRLVRGRPRSRGEAAPPCRSGRRAGICSWRWNHREEPWSCTEVLDRWWEKYLFRTCETQFYLWNTVNPISSAERSRSVENVSFHSGSRTFDFVVVRSTNTSSTSGWESIWDEKFSINDDLMCKYWWGIVTNHNIGVNIWLGSVFLLVKDPVMAAHKVRPLKIFCSTYCHLRTKSSVPKPTNPTELTFNRPLNMRK